MYEGDSFFTLTAMGQVGLAAISAAFAAICLALTFFLARGRALPLRLAFAAVVFFAFVWLSPQGYYTYYRMIIDGLPAQSVVGEPPVLGELIAFVSFTGRATLSAHSTGVLGWALLATAILAPRFRAHLPAEQD